MNERIDSIESDFLSSLHKHDVNDLTSEVYLIVLW